jgi:hypothetical protein
MYRTLLDLVEVMEETSRDCQDEGRSCGIMPRISGPAFWTNWPKPVWVFKDKHFGRMNWEIIDGGGAR